MGGFRFSADMERTVWRVPEIAAVQGAVDATLKGRVNRIYDWDSSFRRFLIFSFSSRDSGAVWILDNEAKKLRKHADVMPEENPEQYGETVVPWVPMRDGRKTLCYLTLPPDLGSDVVPPLIVMLLEDPSHRFEYGFDGTVQNFATHGFAVLQVNHRGAGGFGRQHFEGARGRYADAALEDLEDAVTWAVENGVAERDRVFLVGSRWGGYVALNALQRSPGLYRGVIAVDAIADPMRYEGDDRDWVFADPGSANSNRAPVNVESINATSPVEHAAEIKDPVLFIHYTRGWGSTYTERQTRAARRAFEESRPNVEFLSLDAPNPWGSFAPGSHQPWYDEALEFLERHGAFKTSK